jgi:hypothetical protein
MPTLIIGFEGCYRADTETAVNVETDEEIDVSKMSSKELVEKLQSGELRLDFDKVEKLKDLEYDCDTYSEDDW